jgi:phage repressor protein C with HTH and peptisase S24 domain
MARRKTLPESVRAKLALAERLAALRSELYGDRGGPEMARRLGIPVRTWYNYEGGVTVPAEVILKIIELTSVEAVWLLHGEGPKFRNARPERIAAGGTSSVTIGALLRTALQLLEEKNERSWPSVEAIHDDAELLSELNTSADRRPPPGVDHRAFRELANIGVASGDTTTPVTDDGSRGSEARRDWLAAQRDNRCVFVSGDSMAPIVADGASVAYAKEEDDVQHLDGKLVVAWVDNQPVVRWFQQCGRYALLRAQNPTAIPQQVLVDLDDNKHRPRFRRVLWVHTPH